MQKVVRLKDIAQQAGVHEATVSAVLSESPRSGTRVSAKTADRIRQIAREQNYRPNRHAQIIRRRRSGLLGMVEFGVSEIAITRSHHLANHFYEEGVEFQAHNAKWFKESVSKAVYQLLDSRVEGIVLVMPNLAFPDEILKELERRGIPMVSYNGTAVRGYPQVRSDVELSMEMMVEHLVGLGYRDIALISRWASSNIREDGNWMIRERVSGFERAIVRLGGVIHGESSDRLPGSLVGRIRMGSPSPSGADYYRVGYQAACDALEWKPRPQALICSNDQFAIGVMQACRHHGVSVPNEIAVVGFGNLEVSPYLEVPLTTVDTRPQPDEGRVILQLLQRMIAGEKLEPEEMLIRLPSPLVIRESCGSRLRNESVI